MTQFVDRWANRDVLTLQPYQAGKPIEELERELGITDIIKLASNENPRGPGPAVHAAIARASTTLSRYPDGSGYRLKQALARQLGVDADQISLGNGSNDVLELVARIALSPGSEGIVSTQAFVVYPLAVIAHGGKLVTVPSKNWTHDLDAMARAVTDKTRIVFVANPNNPTGTWVTRQQLTAFLDRIPEHVIVVLDEAYFEYLAASGLSERHRIAGSLSESRGDANVLEDLRTGGNAGRLLRVASATSRICSIACDNRSTSRRWRWSARKPRWATRSS